MFRYLLAASLLIPTGLSAQSAGKPLVREDLEPFLDAIIPNEIAHGNIAGAVVTVVKDGKLLLSKGYGYSDIANKTPVFPDSTLFRIASISKTFNATAVMQLVEQGKLDLDADIQKYLDFPLPRKFPEPITLRHLLTHTAGFEESVKEVTPEPGKTSVPLSVHIKLMTPHQIYRPGTVTSYSNYGADLAGYIVELVSGTPYPEYIRLHILAPLGMLHSSIQEPLPADLARLVSKEYALATDSVRKFEVIQGEPSGNMSSTGMDMANYMIAHLQLGRFDSVRILAESTSRYMSTTQFRTHPAVPGMAVGFFEESRDGYRMIGHGGDLSNFHSHMTLLLDEGVGFFISVNSAGTGGGLLGIRETVIDAFMHRYFPRKSPVEPVLADAKTAAARVAGAYTLSRRGETTMFRISSLALNIDVAANPDGSIEIPLLTGTNGQPLRWTEVEPLVFQADQGAMRLGFVTDSSGKVTRAGFLGGHELHKVGLADNVKFNYWVIGLALTTLVGSLLLWPVAALIRRRFKQKLPDDGLGPRLRGITRVTALLAITLQLGFFLFFTRGLSGSLKPNSTIDPILRLFQAGGLLVLLGTAATVIAALISLLRGSNRMSQLKYVMLAAACVGFSWFILHWNILTTNMDF